MRILRNVWPCTIRTSHKYYYDSRNVYNLSGKLRTKRSHLYNYIIWWWNRAPALHVDLSYMLYQAICDFDDMLTPTNYVLRLFIIILIIISQIIFLFRDAQDATVNYSEVLNFKKIKFSHFDFDFCLAIFEKVSNSRRNAHTICNHVRAYAKCFKWDFERKWCVTQIESIVYLICIICDTLRTATQITVEFMQIN